MSTLLSIPRELRDYILDLVILARQEVAPSLDLSFDDLVDQREILSNPTLRAWSKIVLYKPEHIVAHATGLLKTNRQIRSETLENIIRLQAHQYDLDVIILDEILPLPTWLRVPIVSTSLDAVNVTFRIAGRFDRTKERNKDGSETPYRKYGFYKGFQGGDGAGPAMGWQVYGILERFIKAGPVGKLDDKHADLHRHITVKTININVETPPEIDPSVFRMPSSSSHRGEDGSVLDPEYLVNYIASNISGLLSGGDREWFDYGKILYEHVDYVVISRDGAEIRKLDVAERLRAVGNFAERHVSKKDLEDYKVATWAKRKERGLRVLETS